MLVWALVYPCWCGLVLFIGAAVLLAIRSQERLDHLFRPLQGCLMVLGAAFIVYQYSFNISTWDQTQKSKFGLQEFEQPLLSLGSQYGALYLVGTIHRYSRPDKAREEQKKPNVIKGMLKFMFGNTELVTWR